MSIETRRAEQDITVYQCDRMNEGERCVRETASFQVQDTITVLLDPAWLILRVGLGEERHFCSWDHHIAWVAVQEIENGDFAVRLRTASAARETREAQGAEQSRIRAASRREASRVLETPTPMV